MRILRAGIPVAVAFAVLAHGAVEPWSQATLALLAALLVVVWGIRCVRRQRVELRLHAWLLPLILLGVLVLAQWVFGLSVYPYATRVDWLKLTSLLVIAFLAMQTYRSAEEYRPLVWFLLFLGFAVSLFGILQHFTFNGKLYWFRELRQSGFPFGPYVNRNHFAGLIELIAPFGLAILLHRGVRRDQLPLVGLFTGLSVAALFLSASRGGVVSFFFQLFLLAGLVWVRPVGKRAILAACGVLLLTGTFAIWLGVEKAFTRFVGDWSESVTSSRRVVIVEDSWRIFLDHPWVGTGLGTFQTVYPRYESFYDGKIVNHAHNDYVELLAETGVLGALCLLAFLLLLLWDALPRLLADAAPYSLALRTGAVVAFAGLLLHGLVDFNFRIPSNALLFLLCACMASSPEDESRVLRMRAAAK